MRGDLKITKIKQVFGGGVEKTFLGELGLLDVNEGSMNIYIGYEVKEGLILEIIISSENIFLKMVKHMPVRYTKIKNTYLFSKNEDTTSKMIIGSHVGVNNFDKESLQKILFKMQCNPFSGILKLGEKYLIEVNNGNNTVSIVFDSLGVELEFSKEPEVSVSEVFGIFKENLFSFSLTNIVKEVPIITNSNNVSQKEKKSESKEVIQSNEIDDLLVLKIIGFIIFIIFLLLWSISFFSEHL